MGFFKQTYITGSKSVTVKKPHSKVRLLYNFKRYKGGHFATSLLHQCACGHWNRKVFNDSKVIYDYFNYLPDSIMTICYLKFTRVSDGQRFRRQNSNIRLQISEFRYQNSNFRFQTSDFRFQILDFRLQNPEMRP